MIDQNKIRRLIRENLGGIDYKELEYEITNEGMFNAAYFTNFGCPEEQCPALRFRKRKYPNINDGDEVWEMHIDIPEPLQGKGIAASMLKAFIHREGGCIYFSHGRITNPDVYKVINKIARDKSFAVTDEEGYGIVICEDFMNQ